jgi:hypothetical protein
MLTIVAAAHDELHCLMPTVSMLLIAFSVPAADFVHSACG